MATTPDAPAGNTPDLSLLSQLTGRAATTGAATPWAALAATPPEHEEVQEPNPTLDSLLQRINKLTQPASPLGPPSPLSRGAAPQASTTAAPPLCDPSNPFVPLEPSSFAQAQLTESEVEALILKYLLARGDASGRDIADQVKLPFILLDELLRQMKNEQLVVHRSSAPMNDFIYQPTDLGRERARRLAAHCSYFGSAPVSLKDYVASVQAQSLSNQHPTADDLSAAFSDLLLSEKMLDRLGPAINSGRGLFLFGAPGNGKTSIAQRVTRSFGQYIWIPRAIGIDGEIIRLFDPVNHEEIPVESGGGLLDTRKIDQRWIRIRRPTIIAGGELTMSALEVTINTSTGVSEAPLQLKSNCGTLVIDDFGRQRMRIDELLNRWIVPLEMRIDFLNLPNGKKITVPFDQLIVFSTNLEPRELVDEAFLRRVPYKIEVVDPTEEEFRSLLKMVADKLSFELDEAAIDHLIEVHYKQVNRPFRCCQPRDLLLQVRNYCAYRKCPPRMTAEMFDLAVENYFAVM